MNMKQVGISNLNSLLFSFLILGNVLLGKAYANLNIFGFIYINELVIGLLIVLNVKKLKKLPYFIIILIIPPMFQIFTKNLEFKYVFQDYALIYYPIIIFLLLSSNQEFNKNIRFVLEKFEPFIPFITLYYFIFYTFNNYLRSTEIVVLSFLFFYTTKNKRYNNFEYTLFYLFIFVFVLQARSSMLISVIIIIFLIAVKKIAFKQLGLILFLFVILVFLYSNINISDGPYKDIDLIHNRNSEILNSTECQDYFENIEKDIIENQECEWSNIEWRLVLWEVSLKKLFTDDNYLIKNDLGINLIEVLIDENKISEQMYSPAYNLGLRNLHNSFITALYRFGVIPTVFLLILIFIFFRKYLLEKKYFMFFPFILVLETLSDPILDGPVFAIPFYIILFFLNLENDFQNNQ